MRGRLLLVLGVALTVLLRVLRQHPRVRALWSGRVRHLRRGGRIHPRRSVHEGRDARLSDWRLGRGRRRVGTRH